MTATVSVRTYAHHIDGRAVESPGAPLRRHDPATGELVAEYQAGSGREVDLAVAAARRAFDEGPWPQLPAPERAATLRRWASLVADAAERLAALDSEEVGKPLRLARFDVAGAQGHIEHAASLIETQRGDSWTDLSHELVAYSSHDPAGVAALVIPWNFPALILSQKLPYALAAGCTTVVKPSEFTSSSALEVVALAEQAGVPAGAINVVTGLGADVGAPLVEHPGVDVVSFTGSTATGRAVAAEAGHGLKRVELELGGKAANVVFADADLDEAVAGAVFAAFFNQGECCVAGPRLLVHRSIADAFVERVADRTASLVLGHPRDEATDLGPVIHERHLEKVLEYVELGRKRGGTVVRGGARATGDGLDDGWFVEPTILAEVTPDSPVFNEEVFGPLMSVTPFDDVDEAVRLANATPYGLAHALWTRDVATAHGVARRLRCGTVWVNTNIEGSPAIAFGGVKASGVGREVGREGLLAFCEMKTVQVRVAPRTYPLPQQPAPTADADQSVV